MHLLPCVWECVCSGPLVLNCWMVLLPTAERVQLHSPLCSVLCDCSPLTLLISVQCVRAKAPARPPGIWGEQSRIYTHKSDRCMACHYLPLIIIVPPIFIHWAALAVFPVWLRNICTVALRSDRCWWGVSGYCRHSCSGFLFVCRAWVCL